MKSCQPFFDFASKAFLARSASLCAGLRREEGFLFAYPALMLIGNEPGSVMSQLLEADPLEVLKNVNMTR